MCIYIYIYTHTHTHIDISISIYIQAKIHLYTSQKSILGTREKKNESRHNAKDSHQITREESRKSKKKTIKLENNEQNNSKYISANNYFKCKWTNALIKRYTVADLIKKKHTHIYAANKRLTSNLKTHTD